MPEPSLLAASIGIKEPAFSKFLRGKAGAAFAQAAASIIIDGRLLRMRTSLIAEPAQLSDPLWQEIADGDVTAPFIAMAEKLVPRASWKSLSDQVC
jgi:hypothetical protein